ncbi:MAG: glycosyltransferase [Pirellula sp.]
MVTLWTEWTYWLSSIPRDELLWLILPLALFDGLRYWLTALCVWFVDFASRCWSLRRVPKSTVTRSRYCPSVSIVIAGLNEGDTIRRTLERVWGTYPKMQVIVVDDGSSDNMASESRSFASEHPEVVVISKRRGGKSSAMNAGLAYANGEITIILDADSELAPTAIWDIVQPMQDPRVGAVSGNVRVRNCDTNLLTRMQAFEYLRSVFLGRIVTSRLGLLGIVSGAFGAFRTSLIKDMGGWDVGPGEDEDMVLRIRKRKYKIEFVEFADCFTDVPESWRVLTRQRRRWEWAVITFGSRKHIDMANPFNKHCTWSNMILFSERWFFNLILPLWCWVYVGWLICAHSPSQLANATLLYYFLYLFGDITQYLLIMDFSNHRRKDWSSIFIIPIMPFYQCYQRVVTTISLVEEIFSRRSFRDNFVPIHVRSATWHW